MDPALARGIAGNAVFADQRKHFISSPTAGFDNFLAALCSKTLQQLIGVVFEAGDDLPAVAPRSAPTRLPRIQYTDTDTLFRPAGLPRDQQPWLVSVWRKAL